jgi:hypothetical protein
MNKIKQFISLFRFQSTINPAIWWMPIAFSMPLLLPLFQGSLLQDYHPGFSTLLLNQNLFFVGILGSMILAPEKFQFGGANVTATYFGNEFVLTRAIDRHILYRVRAAFFYFLILTLPCLVILSSLKTPDLMVSEYSKPIQQQAVSHLAGSSLKAPDYNKTQLSLISIPRGKVLVAEWQLWIFSASALTLQLMILILYPFRYAKIIFWIVFFAFIVVPLFDLFNWHRDVPTMYEQAFFQFGAHQPLAWILTACLFIPAQLWCERRFAQLEQ